MTLNLKFSRKVYYFFPKLKEKDFPFLFQKYGITPKLLQLKIKQILQEKTFSVF